MYLLPIMTESVWRHSRWNENLNDKSSKTVDIFARWFDKDSASQKGERVGHWLNDKTDL